MGHTAADECVPRLNGSTLTPSWMMAAVTVVSKTSTLFGDTNDDHHVLIGDTYIGYTKDTGLPNNNDEVGGTLFLHRGLIVGKDNTGNASIGMRQILITDLGDGIYNQAMPLQLQAAANSSPFRDRDRQLQTLSANQRNLVS